MAHKTAIISVLLFTVFLTACGGGSDNSGGESSKKDAGSPSTGLEKTFSRMAESRYTGDLSRTDMASEPEAIQRYVLSLLGKAESLLPPMPNAILDQLGASSGGQLPKNISIENSCAGGGRANVAGTFASDRKGDFNVSYLNCRLGDVELDGRTILRIDASDLSSYTLFYDDLKATTTSGSGGRSFSGVAMYTSPSGTSEYGFHVLRLDLLTTYLSTGKQTLDRTTRIYDPFNAIFEGTIAESDYGKIRLLESSNEFFTAAFFSNGRFRFEGANKRTASVNVVSQSHVELLIDTNGDGIEDSGHYFQSIDQFFIANFATLDFLPVDQLGFAPEVDSPSLITASPDATKELVLEPGHFYDRDTPSENLSVSYQWSVNGTPIPSNTGNRMPSGMAVYGDEVSVTQTVTDGQFSGTSAPLEFVMEDAPATMETTNRPETVSVGESLSFTAMINDPDTPNNQPAEILYGPAGMDVNQNGTVTWTVPKPLFNGVTVRFGLGHSSEGAEPLGEFTLVVNDSEASLPIARSGIEVPEINRALHVADFLGDADNEVITLGSSKVIVLKKDAQGYSQIWAYPYQLPTDGRLRALQLANVDSDSKQELIVATERGISVIYNDSEVAYPLWTTEDFIHAMKIADLSQDGIPEIIVARSDSRYAEGVTLNVFEITDMANPLLELSLSGGIADIATGNLDEDDQLEIALNNGYVFDGLTFANQWFRGSSFGNRHVATGDLDNDGKQEIIASDDSGTLYVYSLETKSLTYSQANLGECALKTANLDVDTASEVISADCYYGNVRAFDWQDNALIQKWQISSQDYGVKSMEVGDPDNDGFDEILWGTGQGNSSPDSLIIASELDSDNPQIELPETATVQLDSFSAAGWGDITPGNEQAIYVIPKTDSGEKGQRLAFLSPDSGWTLTEEISNSRADSLYGQVEDFDQDGYADLFLGSSERYDRYFQALKLDDLTTQWSTGEGRVSVVGSANINGDDYPDALFADGSLLNLVDVKNSTIIATVATQTTISDFDYTSAANGTDYIVTASEYEGIEVWKRDNSAFSLLFEKDLRCGRVQFVNTDLDTQPELVCSVTRNYPSVPGIYVLDLAPSLPELRHIPVDGKVTDFTVDTSSQNQQAIVAGVVSSGDIYQTRSQIRFIRPDTGQTIWSSPDLYGAVTHRSIHYRPNVAGDKSRLMFSTDEAMYLVR